MKNNLFTKWIDHLKMMSGIPVEEDDEVVKVFDVPVHGEVAAMLNCLGYLTDVMDELDEDWVYFQFEDFKKVSGLRKGTQVRILNELKQMGYLEFQVLKFGGFSKKVNGAAVALTDLGYEIYKKIEWNRKLVQDYNQKHLEEME